MCTLEKKIGCTLGSTGNAIGNSVLTFSSNWDTFIELVQINGCAQVRIGQLCQGCLSRLWQETMQVRGTLQNKGEDRTKNRSQGQCLKVIDLDHFNPLEEL